MNRVALVTGGTGLLGSWLIRALAARGYDKIYVLARPRGRQSASARVCKSLQVSQEDGWNGALLDGCVETISGDICEPDLGLSHRTAATLQRRVTDLFHSAALAEFNVPLKIIRRTNVYGTRQVLEFALKVARNSQGPLRVHHISTIAVGGTLHGWFGEDQFDCGQRFYNSYEQSKFEAEALARAYRKRGLPVVIYRPGVITGDSKRGRTTNFKMMYQPLHFLGHNLFDQLPANAQSLHTLVPVDKVAEAVSLLSVVEMPTNGVWHLVNPHEITVEDFVSVASHVFRARRPRLIPLERFPRHVLSDLQWKLIEPFVPYFNYRLRFLADRTNSMLESLGFCWPEMNRLMLAKLFYYCIECGLIRRQSADGTYRAS